MLGWVCDVLLGILPQAFFVTTMLCFMKGIKTKRLSLFLLVFLSFVVSIAIVQYNIILYSIFSLLIFASLRLLYGKEANWLDAICVLVLMSIILAVSFMFYTLLPKVIPMHTWHMFGFTQLTVIALPFILKIPAAKVYKAYCKSWNVGGSLKVKSITVRNISVILFNAIIIVTNYAIIDVLTK